MDANLKADWVAALRSGKYEQKRHAVGRVSENRLCCLGVGAVVCAPDTNDLLCTDDALSILANHGFCAWTSRHAYSDAASSLVSMNDEKEKSFSEIADWIETNIPATQGKSPHSRHYVKSGRSAMDTTSKSDVAWLIELPQHARPGEPPAYWGHVEESEGWTRDINEAFRFKTMHDADMRGSDVGILDYEVIEHAWVATPSPLPLVEVGK